MCRVYFRILTWVALVLLAVGCTQTGEEEPRHSLEFQMYLRVPAAGQVERTRATVNNDYYDGQGNLADGEDEGLDYLLSATDLRVLFYDAEGKFVEEAQVATMNRTLSDAHIYEYILRGRLEKVKSDDHKTYSIVVLANMKGHITTNAPATLAEASTQAELFSQLGFSYMPANIGYTFTEKNWKGREPGAYDDSGRVPMWGKATSELNNGISITINMLRAMAKVRVELNPTLMGQGYFIEEITLHGASSMGFVAPKHADTVTQTSQCTTAEGAALNVPDEAVEASMQTFYERMQGDVTTGKHYIYLPETVNTGAKAGRCYMTVSLKHIQGDMQFHDMHFRLEFGDYQPFNEGGTHYAGTLFDIERNHYYQYVIDGIQGNNPIIKYVVCAWHEKTAGDITFN